MKGYIIGDKENNVSVRAMNTCAGTMSFFKAPFSVEMIQQTSPETLKKDLAAFPGLEWTYPLNEDWSELNGMQLPGYRAADKKTIFSCTISHARLWLRCVRLNEEVMVLEHDAAFIRDLTDFPLKWNGGVLGLNDPRGATHSPQKYHAMVSESPGIHDAPWVKPEEEMPQGLAGNSAYIIKPYFAKMLLEKLKEVGGWPNDALMCKQLFPNELKVIYPYYTRVQGIQSTTTY